MLRLLLQSVAVFNRVSCTAIAALSCIGCATVTSLNRIIGSLLVVISCIGCATQAPPLPEEIDVHVRTFSELTSVQVTSYFEFVPMTGNYLGTCNRGTKTIKLNSNKWHELSFYQREQLIFHELGHCELGLSHDNSLAYSQSLYKNVPASIMNEYFIAENVYLWHRQDYWKVFSSPVKKSFEDVTHVVISCIHEREDCINSK